MLRDRSGNVAIIFALSLIPLVLAAGIAIDVVNIFSSRSTIQEAADVAILAALAESTPSRKRQQVAQTTFVSSLPHHLRDLSPIFNVTIDEDGPERSASATYSVNLPLAFSGVLGVNSIPMSGQTASGLQIGGSMDIHLWLDSSASMGVAATETDRDKLKKLTGCFFACLMGAAPTSQTRAKNAGITLRLDLMKKNILSLMAAIREVQIEGQVVRYALQGWRRISQPGSQSLPTMTKFIQRSAVLRSAALSMRTPHQGSRPCLPTG